MMICKLPFIDNQKRCIIAVHFLGKRFMKRLFLVFLLILSFCWLNTLEAAPAREFIIDTDAGIDDAIAILYLLQNDSVKVKAITIESDSETDCKPAYANLLGIVKMLHQPNIPIACGSKIPLQGHHVFPQWVKNISNSLAGVGFSTQHVDIPKQTAVELFLHTLNSAKHPIDILAIGPLTNIAQAFQQQPAAKNKIRMIYQMGGAVFVPGNIKDVIPDSNNAAAEWNFYIDPTAAYQVFHSGVPITLVPLDVTNTVLIDKAFYQKIQLQHHKPAANLVYQLLNHNQKMLLDSIWYFWDPMAAVIAANESIAVIKTYPLNISLSPDAQLGATKVDKLKGVPVRVCTAVQSNIFKDLLLSDLNQ